MSVELPSGPGRSVYRCVGCHATGLEEAAEHLRCPGCCREFPVIAGVPLLVRQARVASSGYHLSDQLGAAVCQKLDIVPDPETLDALRAIFGRSYELPDLALTAENNYFLNRVVVSAQEKRPPLRVSFADAPVNTEVRYSIDRHYVPAALPPGLRTSFNVRLTNRGGAVISSRTDPPILLSHHWRTGRCRLVAEGHRTRLPIDLFPGRSLTVPMLLEVPARESQLVLEIKLVQEHVRWLEDRAAHHPVTVSAAAARRLPPWELTGVNHGGYNPDHIAGRELLRAEVERRAGPGLRVLEVGGCCSPMMRGLPGEIYTVDIDMQTLQVGKLRTDRWGESIRYVCADGNDLPFRPGAFDVVAMFATLHHFADPAATLRNLSRVVKPGGVIAVMCEPVGHYLDGQADPGLLAELEQGINEQTFSLEEYDLIFKAAGLVPERVVVDVGSLKGLLRAA